MRKRVVTRMWKTIGFVLLFALTVGVEAQEMTVGSKKFTESVILGRC